MPWPPGCSEVGLTAGGRPRTRVLPLRAGPAFPRAGSATPATPASSTSSAARATRGDHLLRMLRLPARHRPQGVTSGQPRVRRWSVRDQPHPLRRSSAADRAFRLKSAIRSRPGTRGSRDLHGQAVQRRGRQRFPPPRLAGRQRRARTSSATRGSGGLSATGRHAIAGVLAHAPALAAILNPTINSYKRFGPDTLAPWLIDWGLDNRSAMVRIPPERGSAARIEVRLGDATANPYLAIAARSARRSTRRTRRAGASPARSRATATTRSGADAARSRCRRRWTRSRRTTELREVLGDFFVGRSWPTSATRSSASNVRDRLGVPRVRLPPVTVQPPPSSRPLALGDERTVALDHGVALLRQRLADIDEARPHQPAVSLETLGLLETALPEAGSARTPPWTRPRSSTRASPTRGRASSATSAPRASSWACSPTRWPARTTSTWRRARPQPPRRAADAELGRRPGRLPGRVGDVHERRDALQPDGPRGRP